MPQAQTGQLVRAPKTSELIAAQVVAPGLSAAARYRGLLLQLQGTTLDDVYEARKIAEPACAALLAWRRTAQDIADLAAVVAEIEAVIENRDGSRPTASCGCRAISTRPSRRSAS